MTSIIQANIKKQLYAKNMTAAELERRTGIPHAVINILHGRSKNPSIRTAQAIAKELGCSVEDLLNETGAKPVADLKNSTWDHELYQQAFNAVYNCILRHSLKPDPKQVSECITEVYLYAIGSKTNSIDERFVQWLIEKTLKHNSSQD
jgi:transcriptional regulator with XRE-family HTH domain